MELNYTHKVIEDIIMDTIAMDKVIEQMVDHMVVDLQPDNLMDILEGILVRVTLNM